MEWGDFLLFAAVGFLAQVVDGALGMAYGVISTTVLLTLGVAPANASASVHVAEVFTTFASAVSHLWHRNVDKRLFWRLAPAGVVGGVIGAYVLTSIDGDTIKPFILAYMAIMGVVIVWRTLRAAAARWQPENVAVAPLGLAGGFVDAVGGGGWGPVVSSTLVGAGAQPRYAIGTVNTAEFFVTVSISAAFIVALATGHWSDAGGLEKNASAIAGLIVGGLCAAPVAGYAVKTIPSRALGIAVGALVLALVAYQAWRLFG
jgi:uncharacterized protein